MPLLDHFHPPLLDQRHWEGFHGWWAAALAGNLNEDLLPPEFFAEEHAHAGARVEVDVATFEDAPAARPAPANGPATAVQPPACHAGLGATPWSAVRCYKDVGRNS